MTALIIVPLLWAAGLDLLWLRGDEDRYRDALDPSADGSEYLCH